MIVSLHDVAEKTLHSDVVIVGSGAAGAILAHELAHSGVACTVLEEGSAVNRGELSASPRKIVSRLYREQGFFASLGKPVIPIPLGRCLGGTTVINSGTWLRTPLAVIQSWQRDLGLQTLTPAEFDRLASVLENFIGVETAKFSTMGASNTKFNEGLKRLGLEGKPLVRNTRDCVGSGFCCYGCPTQAKQSMDVSIIPRASGAGAQFIVDAKVEKIVLKGSRVAHLIVRDPRQRQGRGVRVTARHFVLAAGAIGSPALLQKSGICLKQVGRNLTIHPTTKVLALFDEKINGWRGTPQALAYDGLQGEGIMFEGVFLPPDVLGAALPFYVPYEEIMDNMERLAGFGALIHDSQAGRVRHLPLVGTKVFYSLGELDVRRMQKAIAFMARVYLKAGARKVFTFVKTKKNVLASEGDVDEFAGLCLKNTDVESMAFHPLGTCRMGTSAKDSVVDERNLVHGLENLFVCDGSVVPTKLGVNPQATIMCFALRLAESLHNRALNSVALA